MLVGFEFFGLMMRKKSGLPFFIQKREDKGREGLIGVGLIQVDFCLDQKVECLRHRLLTLSLIYMTYFARDPLGYKKLLTWRQADEIYQKTEAITAGFHPIRDSRLIEQMVSSARSV